MGIITDIKLQKSKARANIFIDHNFCCGLNLQTIVQNNLKNGTEITEAKLLEIQKESELLGATEKALSLLERQKYTSSRLKSKLKEKGYIDELIDEVIAKLKSTVFNGYYAVCHFNMLYSGTLCKCPTTNFCNATRNIDFVQTFNSVKSLINFIAL